MTKHTPETPVHDGVVATRHYMQETTTIARTTAEQNMHITRQFADLWATSVEANMKAAFELQNAAKRKREGWLYIIDCRVTNPQAEVETEDVIAAFKIDSGLIVPDSYRRNNQHRLVSKRGPFCLDDWLTKASQHS